MSAEHVSTDRSSQVLAFPRVGERRVLQEAEEASNWMLRRVLHSVTPMLSAAQDRSFMGPLVNELVSLFQGSRCSIMILETPGDLLSALRVAAHFGLPEAALLRDRHNSGVAARVLSDAQPTLILDRSDFGVRFSDLVPRDDIGSSMCAPIATPHGTIFGVLNVSRVQHTNGPPPFSPVDLEVSDAIAMLMGDTLERLQSREAERELRERMRAVERLSVLGEVAAGIAHEIANPMATVRSNVIALSEYMIDLGPLLRQAAGDMASPASDLPHLVEDVREGVARVEDIITRMKGMVQLDAPNRRDKIDVPAIVGSALRLVRSRLRSQIRIDIPDGLQVLGNSVDLTQVIVNLVVNADDACTERIERESAGSHEAVRGLVQVAGRQVDQRVIITITDNGTGIEKALLQRIFQPLFTTKGNGKGTGLGLSISRRLVEDQGGRLEVESSIGRGTTFNVVLPAVLSAVDPRRDVLV
jgi:signal transduction histidine kinase